MITLADHDTTAASRIVEQLKGKGRFRAVISAIMKELQAVEVALYDLFTLRDIDNGVGHQLDVIGKIVKQPRGNSPDDGQYRARLRARVRAERSSGTIEEILAVFRALLPDAFTVLRPMYPAALVLEILDVVDAAYAALYSTFLRDSKAAGVGGHLLWSPVVDDDAFTTESLCTYVDSFVASGGDNTITVVNADEFPLIGTLRVQEGSNQETVTYTSKNTVTFFLATSLIHTHPARSTVALVGTDGLGFGTTTNPAIGGALTGVIGV